MLFIDNKYTKWYMQIIATAQSKIYADEVYIEKHHIIPKSLGGSDDNSNIVRLPLREHFICHLLLPKMVSDPSHLRKMRYAAFKMTHARHDADKLTVSSKIYEIIRKEAAIAKSETHKGKVAWNRGKVAWNRGIPMTSAAKEKASKSLKGMTSWNKGIPASVESNEKRKAAQTGVPKPKVICPHCSKRGGAKSMQKHHFNNCKLIANPISTLS